MKIDPSPLRLLRALLLAALSGALLAACQVDAPVLAWLALAPLTLGCVGRRARSGFVLGMLSGLMAGAALYGTLSYGWLIYGMLVVYCGLHMGLFGALQSWAFARVHPLIDLLLPALAWTALEYLRRVGSVSFPINLAATQVDLLPLLQVARWTGGHGVSFLVALPSGLLVRAALLGRIPLKGLVGILLTLLLTLAYGGWRLTGTQATRGPSMQVSGVQTAFPNWLYELETVSPQHRVLLYEALFGMTDQAASLGAELIVWPETALRDRYLEDPELRTRIQDIARHHGAAILAGLFREDEIGLEHNCAALFDPAGGIEVYDKRRLAGLAEWRMTPGTRNAPLRGPKGPIGVLICLESVYPQDARELTLAGAELLVVTTNDAGFLRSPMAGFHGHRSTIRAIESDRFLMHLSQAGPSAILDPLGRSIARTEIFRAELLQGTVELRSSISPYHRHGDWFPALVFLGLALCTLAPLLVRCRRGSDGGS